jgi:hypothetical protein
MIHKSTPGHTVVAIPFCKLAVVFKPGSMPQVNPDCPYLVLDLGGTRITARLNPRAARKLAAHKGAAVLQGRLVVEQGELVLLEGGFQFNDPKPIESAPPPH